MLAAIRVLTVFLLVSMMQAASRYYVVKVKYKPQDAPGYRLSLAFVRWGGGIFAATQALQFIAGLSGGPVGTLSLYYVIAYESLSAVVIGVTASYNRRRDLLIAEAGGRP